jgi:hypothetical protein
MIAGLFQKVEQIFSRDEFEEEEQKRLCFEGAVEGDDVGVGREGLVDGNLESND